MAPVPEVAYLISSDTAPAQVTRLAAVLRSGSSGAVIAVAQDASAGSLDLRRMHELDVDLLETTSVVRGSAAELLMVLRCLRRLLASRFDWLVLISGSDYPIRPLAEIEASLAGADVDGFIETHRCEPPARRRGAPVDEHAARYHYRWSPMPGTLVPVARAFAAAASPCVLLRATPDGVRLGVRAKRSPFTTPKRKALALPRRNPLSTASDRAPFGEGLECHYGPGSFVLSRRAVGVIDEAVRAHPELVLYYRDTLVPAESYIHTVLVNDPSISLQAESRRFELAGAVADVDAVLASHADFAGPFDLGSDLATLDAIDARVHRA